MKNEIKKLREFVHRFKRESIQNTFLIPPPPTPHSLVFLAFNDFFNYAAFFDFFFYEGSEKKSFIKNNA